MRAFRQLIVSGSAAKLSGRPLSAQLRMAGAGRPHLCQELKTAAAVGYDEMLTLRNESVSQPARRRAGWHDVHDPFVGRQGLVKGLQAYGLAGSVACGVEV